jgi:CRP-like cAMP-binding protein
VNGASRSTSAIVGQYANRHHHTVVSELFYLAEGELEIVEVNKRLGPGAVIGDVGVFAPDQRRTATVKCETDCRIYEMTGAKAKELYFQDPPFAYAGAADNHYTVAGESNTVEASRTTFVTL